MRSTGAGKQRRLIPHSLLDAPFLQRLFPGHDFSRYWPARRLVAHGPLERLAPLPTLAELTQLPLLLHRFGPGIRAALPDKRDEHSSREVDAETAISLHRDGMALILDGVERVLPDVQRWLSGLAAELDLPLKCNPRSIVYATPPGGGNSPHFDANANFVLQLRGTKRWRIAPNLHVANPTDRFAMNQETPPEELEAFAPFPTEMPEGTETIELKPGSVLFVPRGHWHSTESDEDTLALNFTYGQPTWADVTLAALRRRLIADPEWRALATGPRADPSRLMEMLERLSEEVGFVSPDDVTDAMNPREGWLLSPDAFLLLDENPMRATLGAKEFTLELDDAARPALEWISQQGGPFTPDELSALFPSLDVPRVLKALRGLLTRVS